MGAIIQVNNIKCGKMAENGNAGSENSGAASENSSAVVLHKDLLNTSSLGKETLVEMINHISSFIRVLKSRILFMYSGLGEAQQQRRSRSVTENTSMSEYKANLEEFFKKVEQVELNTAVFNSAIRSVEMEEYLNKSKEAIIQIVNTNSPAEEKQILDNFVDIVDTTNNIISATVELQECHSQIIKAKREYVQKLEDHRVLREERLAIQDAEETPDVNNVVKLENMVQKKMDNLNIMRGIILTILTNPFLNIDFNEHPELLEITKKWRKRFSL